MGHQGKIDKKDLKELLSKGWMTHDAMWFYHCLNEFGIEKTNEMNLAAVRSMSAIEIMRLKKILGIPKDKNIETFEEFKRFTENINALIIPDFMKFTFSFPEENVMHFEFMPEQCFAYKGIKSLGVIDSYQCGVLQRIDCWFEGLGLEYAAEPGEVGECMMNKGGRCFREYRFKF